MAQVVGLALCDVKFRKYLRQGVITPMVMPLSASALQPDETWNRRRVIRCECGAENLLWEKRCPTCRRKNAFPKLLKKRKRVERWFNKVVQQQVVSCLQQRYRVLQTIERYNSALLDIRKRPFPARMKAEDLNHFSQRVIKYFESLFKTTSPANLAREIDSQLDKTAQVLSLVACDNSTKVLLAATCVAPSPFANRAKDTQAQQVHQDLLSMSKPFIQALQTMQLYHKRIVAAYKEARPILSQNHTAGRSKTLWNKARSAVKSIGWVLNFGTAIWNNSTQREQLERFDAELIRFHEQIERFQKQYQQLLERQTRLLRTQTLSFRKHLVHRLTEQIACADSQTRKQIVQAVLCQKGVGSGWWRLWCRLRSG